MTNPQAAGIRNSLLEKLPGAQRKNILSACELVELELGQNLSTPDCNYDNVYFPLTGFISLVTEVRGQPPLQMAMIGSEGMLGVTLILGVPEAPLQSVVQGSGTALVMNVSQFYAALNDNYALRPVLHRYLYVLTQQLYKTAACTHYHDVEKRLVRWLLMAHDRAHADRFHLTHQFLADMLGVRRSAVTLAAGVLKQQAIVHYTRGQITILDRKALESRSCECYEAVVGDYRRQFSGTMCFGAQTG